MYWSRRDRQIAVVAEEGHLLVTALFFRIIRCQLVGISPRAVKIPRQPGDCRLPLAAKAPPKFYCFSILIAVQSCIYPPPSVIFELVV